MWIIPISSLEILLFFLCCYYNFHSRHLFRYYIIVHGVMQHQMYIHVHYVLLSANYKKVESPNCWLDWSTMKGSIRIFNCQMVHFLFPVNIVSNYSVDDIHFILLIRNTRRSISDSIKQTISQVTNVLIDREIYGERGCCKLSKLSKKNRIKISNLTS